MKGRLIGGFEYLCVQRPRLPHPRHELRMVLEGIARIRVDQDPVER